MTSLMHQTKHMYRGQNNTLYEEISLNLLVKQNIGKLIHFEFKMQQRSGK